MLTPNTLFARSCAGLATLVFMGACLGAPAAKNSTKAIAEMKPASGSTVSGTVWFTQAGDNVTVRTDIKGLKPGQEHGFHVHEKGDCATPDATSAGGHFNPNAKPHGAQHAEHHAGDLPALKADASGVAKATFTIKGVLLGSGAGDLVGKGLIIHAMPDDYATQPTGNSGARWACGVIAVPATPSGIGAPASTVPKQM